MSSNKKSRELGGFATALKYAIFRKPIIALAQTLRTLQAELAEGVQW